MTKKVHPVIFYGVVFSLLAISAYLIYDESFRIKYGDVTVDQAKKLIKNRPGLVILDVRTEAEFSEGHIEGAINIPLDELVANLGIIDTSDEILVYCKSGFRSSVAVSILRENGLDKIFHLVGGIEAWEKMNYPIAI